MRLEGKMIRVRFSNGLSVEYKDANHLRIENESPDRRWVILDRMGGTIIATIQDMAGVIVEFCERKRVKVRK